MPETPAARTYDLSDHFGLAGGGAPRRVPGGEPIGRRTLSFADGVAYGQAADDLLRGDVLTGLAKGAVLGTASKGRMAAVAAKTVLFYVHPVALIFAMINMLCEDPNAPEPTNDEVIRNAGLNIIFGAVLGHPGG